MSTRQAAEQYIAEGFAVLPIPKGQKGPRIAQWTTKTFGASDFTDDENIGVRCGEASGHLVDVDLDCEEAIQLSHTMLPPTGRIHGRASKPGSHRWYTAPGIKTKRYEDHEGGVICELRGDQAQTVVPPSVHPSGEAIVWDSHREITEVDPRDLERSMAVMASCVLVSRQWNSGGSRHDIALAFAGFLANRGLTEDQIVAVIANAAELAGDTDRTEVADRERAARDTVKKKLAGQPVVGGPRLGELIGPGLVAKLQRWLGGEEEDVIDLFNERHFIVGVGATMAVGDEDARHELPLIQTFTQLRQRYCKQFITKAGKTTPVADVWLKHPRGRQYEQLVFAPPPRTADPKDYNLWRGFAVTPQPGDWSLMQEHLHEIICAGDAKAADYLLGWMALAVQRPGEVPEVSIALRGGRGTGKGLFVRAFGELFGPHFLHLSSSDQLTRNFNAHLGNQIIVFADEAYWAGDRKGESNFKRLITEPTLLIERKGIDAQKVDNFTHLILATNNDWSFPAGHDERRVCALAVSDKRVGDHAYFAALAAEVENGGKAAMLYDLQRRDLSSFNKRAVPQTDELLQQKLQSMGPIRQWWYGVLEQGQLGLAMTWPNQISRAELTQLVQTALRNDGASVHSVRTKLGMALKELLPGGPQGQRGAAGYWNIPPLVDCRAHFGRLLGGKIDWQEPSRERLDF